VSDVHEHAPLAAPIGFAHRGGMGDAPQNTLGAFAAALTAGATGLESDVWLSADGFAVLDHDGLIGEGQRIADVARGELPGHIPTLSEFYAACGSDFELSLDILDPRAARVAIGVAERVKAVGRLWVVGEWPKVAPVRALNPDAHVVANLVWWRLGPGVRRLLRECRSAGICAINMPFWLWNPWLVGQTHAAGMLAFGWRANENWQIEWLRRCHCDAIYSDSVGLLVQATAPRPRPAT
jgi:glycerophosphoryl diester phosphodiesterase